MKTKLLPIFLLLNFALTLFGCRDEKKIPETEDVYIFSFKSEVDAKAIGCGYTYYEEIGDLIKKRIRKKVPNLSTEDLIELGDFFHDNYIKFPIVEHDKSDWAIEIVERMKPFLVENEFQYNVYTVNESSFNAFTIPGGNIYVTTGLLDAVSNQDELAYIMGHELGHNENDHTKELARLYKYVEAKEKEGSFLSLSNAFITKIAASICGKSDELECDISSMYLLNKAGYDPEKALGGIDLLRSFNSPRPDNEWKAMLFAFFSTHPWSEDRDNCVTSYVREAKVRVECEKIFDNSMGSVITKQSPLNAREYPIKNSKKDTERC